MNRKVILHKSAVEELNLIKQRVYELFGYNVANKVVKNLIYLVEDNEIMIVAIWDNRKNEENLQDMLSKRISE